MVKVAILHEGNSKKTTDNELLKLLIEELNLDIEQVEFFGFGTKSNFFKLDNAKYRRLKMQIEENEVSSILFVVDADYEANDIKYGGYQNTKEELEKIIEELDLEVYSDKYITCDPNTQCGYLESLILSTIPKEQKECIETFLECSEFKSKENHKAILNQIYKTAYPNAPFDFSHENFDELKQKLKNLFKEEN
jgi:tRNA nucleotidyltransferase (CCA-adding enzyme)